MSFALRYHVLFFPIFLLFSLSLFDTFIPPPLTFFYGKIEPWPGGVGCCYDSSPSVWVLLDWYQGMELMCNDRRNKSV